MTSASVDTNPYHYRTPVRERRHLVGSKEELQVLESSFRALASGRGVHIAIQAPPARGKTSLLNVGAEIAAEGNLLPVRLDVSTLLFDSDIGFFRALFEAVLVSLSSYCRFEDLPDRYASIARGAVPADEGAPTIAFPVFSACEVDRVSPPLLGADFQKAVDVANTIDRAGVVFFLDDAEYLFEQAEHAVLEAFDVLLAANTAWAVVLAARTGTAELAREHSYSLFQRFLPVSIGRLDLEDVRSLVAIGDPALGASLELATAFDMWVVSLFGHPYWITVAAHLMWDGLEGNADRGERFKLTPKLIKRLTRLQKGRQADPTPLEKALERMDTIDSMRDELVETASRLAPYQSLSLTEYVLAQRSAELAAGHSLSDDLTDAIAAAEATLQEVVDSGLVEMTEDRFQVAGEPNTGVYLRYEAARRSGEAPQSALGHSSYGTAAAPSWLERLGRELAGVVTDMQVATYLSASDDGEPIDEPFRKLQDAVDQRDAIKIAAAGLVPPRPALSRENDAAARQHGLSYVGIVFAVGVDSEFTFELQRVACGWLRVNTGEVSDFDCGKAVQAWLAEHEAEMAEYRIRPVEVVAGTIPPDVARETIPLLAPAGVPDVVVDLYFEKKLTAAADYLAQAVRAFERGREAPETPWRYDYALEDACTRLGFIAALLGRQAEAWGALKRAEELQSEGTSTTERVLVRYNLAHVRALRGEFAAAADWTLHAAESARPGEIGNVYLLLYLPAPRTWSPPDAIWSTARVDAEDVASTLLAQARCLEALAGRYDRSEFAQVVGDTGGLGVAALRVLGWTWLTRFNDSSEAERLFGAASANASDEDADVLRHELEYARRALSTS